MVKKEKNDSFSLKNYLISLFHSFNLSEGTCIDIVPYPNKTSPLCYHIHFDSKDIPVDYFGDFDEFNYSDFISKPVKLFEKKNVFTGSISQILKSPLSCLESDVDSDRIDYLSSFSSLDKEINPIPVLVDKSNILIDSYVSLNDSKTLDERKSLRTILDGVQSGKSFVLANRFNCIYGNLSYNTLSDRDNTFLRPLSSAFRDIYARSYLDVGRLPPQKPSSFMPVQGAGSR